MHHCLCLDDASSLNGGWGWGQTFMKGSLCAGHSLSHLLFHLFFSTVPRNSCHYPHVMDERSPEKINKFPKCIQPVKNRVEVWVQGFFLTLKCRIFPLHQNFGIVAYMLYLEPLCHSANVQDVSFCFLFFFFVAPRGFQDLSSPTGDWTGAKTVKALSPNHWTARELPGTSFC